MQFPFNLGLRSHLGLVRALISLAAILAVLLISPGLRAQVSGSISGAVLDPSDAAVPGAKVVLLDQASQVSRETVTNESGYFTFAGVTPSTYSLRVEAKGFKGWQQGGIVMHTSDVRTLSNIHLSLGVASETVEVSVSAVSVVPTDSGAREDILSRQEIEQLPLVSRNISELLKVLPGVTTTMNATANGVGYNLLNAGASGSTIGVGLDVNGAAYRGGTGYTSDGANIIDPGCNCWAVATITQKMTQEVQVQTSNFGADVQKGPVVVNTIGKSGTKEYHGEGYFDARNDVLNANDWHDNSLGNKRGEAHYYYPGGNFGGPVPFTKKKVFFWFGYEHLIQNTGSASTLSSFIPAAGMLKGNFTSSGEGVAALCPNLNASGNSTAAVTGTACASVNGMVLPDGTTVTNGIIPSQYLDPGASALASIWPAANITDATAIAKNNGNYFQSFPAIHNGYIYRMRYDYDLNDSNKFFVSYQYGDDSSPAAGTGAHVWYTPSNSIQFPGGGIQAVTKAKVGTAHFIHVFSSSMTNEFLASWGWGSGPQTANLSAVTKTKLGYTYGSVFKNPGITMIPSYYSAGNFTYPEFSQPDLFEGGAWASKKQMPSFADNFTKVWHTHTIKFGGYYENTGNLQAGFNFGNGVFSFGKQQPNYFNPTGPAIGSSVNPLADFVTGIASGYTEASSEPYQDMAYRTLAGYIDDSWKATRRLTVQVGFRFDHIGRWYDRAEVGMAAFFPDLVAIDTSTGKANPGVRYHGIDPGVPNGGSPVRDVFVSPRFGVAYDLFGTGKTVLRGGWGRYRWNDQVNDYLGTLQVSQGLQTFNLAGGKNILLSQVGNLPAPTQGVVAPGTTSGSIYATDPFDNEIPLTTSYNFTISQELRWRTLFQIAYVGSQSSKLLIGGQNGTGNNFGQGSIIDRNKMALGALFQTDPVTGLVAADPENPGKTCAGATCNAYVDYFPYRTSYGTNQIIVPEHIGYSNYNALQMAWAKPTGIITFNLNYTWSKALGTALGSDAYSLDRNYGVLAIDRSHVINMSYAFNVPLYYHGESKVLRGAAGGWTIAGLTTWQSGANMPANYGGNGANFGFSYNYFCAKNPDGTDVEAGCSAALTAHGSSAIGDPSYYGVYSPNGGQPPIAVMPVLTCNPTSGLKSNQAANLSCFAPPAVGSLIGASTIRNLPYIKGPAYWDSDLAIAKSFHITERQSVEVRASATNWLNHPLVSFSGTNQLQLVYQKEFITGAVVAAPKTSNYGVYDTKVGQPNQRIMLLSVRYTF